MSTPLLLAGILQAIAATRPLYLLIWTTLVALSVFLIVSMRTRWGRSRPLYRCAALSLLVHCVLIGLAMTVKLVVGDGGNGIGPPIRVRVVDEISRPGSLDVAAAPKLLDVDEAKTASDAVTPEEVPAPESMVEAPPLLAPPPEPVAEAKPPVAEEPAAVETAEVADAKASEAPLVVEETATPKPVAADANAGSPSAREAIVAENAAAAITPTPVAATQPATSPYSRRNENDRLHWAEQQGGSRQTEAAVNAALEWLAKSQSPDGRWDASRFGAGVEMQVLGQDRGGAGADADPGISALSLLAFLGAGHSHQEGDYQSTVQKGLEFLARGQTADGHLANGTGLYAQMYCHSMATFALAEALAMTGDQRLEPTVRRAVNYSLRAQHPSTGGWRYRIGDLGDTSQLGWQLMALWSAERAGMKIPPQTWTGAERFLRSVRRGRSGGLASYRPDGPASTPMTAEALYCRHIVRDMLGGVDDAATSTEAMTQILATPPDARHVNLYYWYYGTLALHFQQEANDEAARAWQTWNGALTEVLVDSQESDGSWKPSCVWGGYGGRIYSTAVSALCLEVYYRYAPLRDQDRWTATRPENPVESRRLPR